VSVGDPPFMTLAASLATRQDPPVADTQQRVEFALDTDVNVVAGIRTFEEQTVHRGLHWWRLIASCVAIQAGFPVAIA
jgi:hypothetical protein